MSRLVTILLGGGLLVVSLTLFYLGMFSSAPIWHYLFYAGPLVALAGGAMIYSELIQRDRSQD